MLKKWILFASMLACAAFAAELGTAENPLTIDSEDDLALLRDAVNAGSGTFKGADVSDGAAGLYFKLSQDLDLSSLCGENVGSWAPIGTYEHPFKGNFDGNGKTIDYLYINEPSPAQGDVSIGASGLFGVVYNDDAIPVEITNLTIGENSKISSGRNGYVGSVVGEAVENVIISNCKNKGSVTGKGYVGGIVGFVINASYPDGGGIKNCTNEGYVNSAGNGGGIIGIASGAMVKIDGCTNFGIVAASDTAAGIVAGIQFSSAQSAKLNNLINKGYVTSGRISGGIVGFAGDAEFSIENSFNSGYVQAPSVAGGIVGQLHWMGEQNISKCVNTGSIFAPDFAGGIIGRQLKNENNLYGTISQTLNVGTISASLYAGGIVGYSDNINLYANNNMNAGIVYAGRAGGFGGKISGDASIMDISANLSVGTPDSFAIYDSLNYIEYSETLLSQNAKNAYRTDSLITGDVLESLGDSLWIYKEGYYPQIKALAESPIKEIRDAQAIASTPIFFATNDKASSVTDTIRFLLKDASGNDVSANAAFGNMVFINDSMATPYSLDEDTLYISNENAVKKIVVNVVSLGSRGTVEDPLTISSVEELLQFRNALANASAYKGVRLDENGARLAFKITNDLDLSSVCGPTKGNWTPIKGFKGKFNGANHKISNLYFNDTTGNSEGSLFSVVSATNGDTVIIENLFLEDVNIRTGGQSIAVALSSHISGNVAIVRNISVNGTIQGKNHTAGILGTVGPSYLYLQDNTVEGTLIAEEANGVSASVGGIAAVLFSGVATVSGNTNRAKITSNVQNAGGIVGSVVTNSIIENNTNEGTIEGSEGYFVGGLFGVVTSNSKFVNNHNKGKISFEGGEAYVGGVAGLLYAYSTDEILKNVSNEGSIDVKCEKGFDNDVGGLFGRYSYGHASELVNKGNINVQSNCYDIRIGGIISNYIDIYNLDSLELVSVTNEGEIKVEADTVNATAYIAGIFADDSSMKINVVDATNTGSISVNIPNGENSYVGGIVSFANTAHMESCVNRGEIRVHGGSVFVGGIAGLSNTIQDSSVTIDKCGNEADIYASKTANYSKNLYMGGLVGLSTVLRMDNSYNSGSVHAGYGMDTPQDSSITVYSDYVGGLVGYISTADGTRLKSRMDNSVNIGDIYYETTSLSANPVGIGGVIGFAHNHELTLENVANYGSIYTDASQPTLWLGGIIGFSGDTLNVKNVISGGSVVVDGDADNMEYGSVVGSPRGLTSSYAISSALAHGSFFGKNAERYFADAWDSVVVDNQWEILDTNDAFDKLHTAGLITDTLPAMLSSENWVAVKGYYPQLKTLAQSPVEAVRKISALGATPVYLASSDSDYVHADSIDNAFVVALKDALGQSVTWTSNVPQVSLNADTVSFKALNNDTMAVLTVKSGDFAKSVWVHLIAIEKADLDFSKVAWDYTSPFTYDGKTKSVALEGLPAEVTAIYHNASEKIPGTYVAYVTLQYDSSLYKIPNFKDSLEWTINKDTLNLSKVKWNKKTEYKYDHTKHSVKLENVPKQVAVDYIDATHEKPGVYYAKAILHYDTTLYEIKNYKDSVLVWKIVEKSSKIAAAIPVSNRVNLIYLGARTWSLVFSQAVPANAKVYVIGIDGKRVAVKTLRGEHSIELQDMPTNGIAFVHVVYPGMSKTFRVNF